MSEGTTPSSTPAKSRWRPILIGGIVAFILAEIIALSPSSIEKQEADAVVEPGEIVEHLNGNGEETLATGVPRGRIPDYSVDGFDYVSTQAGKKQWKLVADKAFVYQKEQLNHARKISAQLFDPEGKITFVTGKEAKYYSKQRDLEVFGNVHTTFPDGFELVSEYLRYMPATREIFIPPSYAVHGEGKPEGSKRIAFDSKGLEFKMAESRILLPSDVRLVMTSAPGEAGAVPSSTRIESDRCVIDRSRQIAHFTMSSARPVDTRFVRITQPGLYARARRSDLSYGDIASLLQYMVAYEDVLITETPKKARNQASHSSASEGALRYGTGGRADFDTKQSLIVLREFPQVYQDNDTVTGDVIIVHRDTDVVEVEHSNAFTEGGTAEGGKNGGK
jgi:LPS export ABC transporter protein LptC